MKYKLLIFISVSTVIACRKSNNLDASDNGSKLIAISNDSAGEWRFGYTGNFITGIIEDTTPYRDGRKTANIQYTNTGSIQIVTIIFPDSSSYIYSLSYSKLPLRIDQSNYIDGIEHNSNFMDFSYFPSTDLLDSVIVNGVTLPLLNGVSNGHIIFKFIYTGQNITNITESIADSNNQNVVLSTSDFTYSATPNIFRHTDSLLYIYTYPQIPSWGQPQDIAVFFAETFSASTFNSVTTSDVNNGIGDLISISSKMVYSLNANGRIIQEAFDSGFEGIVGKRYYYQN